MRAFGIAVALLLCGCIQAGVGAPEATLHLYVSNQSFEQPQARIQVEVDGVTVFEDEAPVEDQHHWILTEVAMAHGRRSVTVRESHSQAAHDFQFEADGDRWVVVDYWTSPPRFSHSVHDRPVYFD